MQLAFKTFFPPSEDRRHKLFAPFYFCYVTLPPSAVAENENLHKTLLSPRVHETIALMCFHTVSSVLFGEAPVEAAVPASRLPGCDATSFIWGIFSVCFLRAMMRCREKSTGPSRCSVWSASRLCEESWFLQTSSISEWLRRPGGSVCPSRFCYTRSWSGYQEMLESILAEAREQEPKTGREPGRSPHRVAMRGLWSPGFKSVGARMGSEEVLPLARILIR